MKDGYWPDFEQTRREPGFHLPVSASVLDTVIIFTFIRTRRTTGAGGALPFLAQADSYGHALPSTFRWMAVMDLHVDIRVVLAVAVIVLVLPRVALARGRRREI